MQLGGILLTTVRGEDVVGRLGREEFVVLAAVKPDAPGDAVGERLRQAVRSLSGPVPVTVSVGSTTLTPRPGDDAPAKLARALRGTSGCGPASLGRMVGRTSAAVAPWARERAAGPPVAGRAVLTPGETRFARSGAVDVAYQVVGEGERDLLVGIGWVSHLELLWELPEAVHFLQRLGRLGRLILFDARGTGLSDRPPGSPGVEELVPDVLAVLDAVGCERAVVVGWLDKAALALAVAARHPERVSALVLGEAAASMLPRAGHPSGLDPADGERLAAAVESGAWGTAALLPWIAPSVAEDSRIAAWWRRWERMSATPNTAASLLRTLLDVDLRHLLPAVTVPVLLVHRSQTRLVPAESIRWLADALPDARVMELPGADLPAFFGDTDTLMDEVEDFLGGTRTGSDADRRVLTMLVTDVVGSTEQAARLGDRRWAELIAWHHQQVRGLLARHGGQEIDTAGDGFLAVFDLPSRAVTCAVALRDHLAAGGLTIRAGLHTGEVVRGAASVRGLAVHVAARVAATAEPGQVRTTGTVRDLLLGVPLGLEPCGSAELKGVPGRWELWAAGSGERGTPVAHVTPRPVEG